MFLKRILFLIFFITAVSAAQMPDAAPNAPDSVTQTDSLAPAKAAVSPQDGGKIPLTKHTYDHKSQIILAAGMMAFIAIIMGTAQSWNPR
jgi:hypothetical protein